MLYSTAHLVNFCPRAISIKEKRSVQGYDTWSTWSRGQAWAILGYAQTFAWTRDPEFLDVACGLAEYFLLRMESAPDCVEVKISDHHNAGRYVPMWDFDAPVEADSSPLRDTSAGTAAANGILILAQSLAGLGKYALSERYRKAALDIVKDTLAFSLSAEKARLLLGSDGQINGIDEVSGSTFEAILRNATVSNNPLGYMQIKDHGLVYADYYLIEFGTRLLRLGMV